MPTDAAFWTVVIAFVSALGTTIITVLRALTTGKIVVGRHYEDSLRREESWRRSHEIAMQANQELSGHLGRLTTAMEQSTAAMQASAAVMQQSAHVTQEAMALLRASPQKLDRPA